MKNLVIRPGALGDTILTLPLLNTLVTTDPGGNVTFLGTGSYLPLVPSEVDTLPVDSAAAVWLFEDNPRHGPSLQFLFDQAYVILRHPNTVMKNLCQAGTKNVISVNPLPIPGEHIVETMHKCAGFPPPPKYPALMSPRSHAAGNLVWIHPGSGGKKKCLPLELFTVLALFLKETFGVDIVVTASEQDEFVTQLPAWETFLARTGALSMTNRPLTELTRQLRGSDLFLGNDSGIGHVAAALGIKSAIFFLDTDPIQWAPWVPPHQLEVFDFRYARPHLPVLCERLCSLFERENV